MVNLMAQALDRGGPPPGPSILFNGQQTFAPTDRMTGRQLYDFFKVPDNHRLFLEAPGSHPDIRILKDDTPHDIRAGQQYYDLPEGQFGAMLPRIEHELEDLRGAYGMQNVLAEEQPDGSLRVTIKGVPVPQGWNRKEVTLRFVVPPGYPQARPQAFFTESDFALVSGGPGSGTGLQPQADGQWKQFCWQPKVWEMSRETLLRYAKFAESRFHELQ